MNLWDIKVPVIEETPLYSVSNYTCCLAGS